MSFAGHDWVTSTLATYALRPMADVSDEATAEAIRRVIDSVAVGVAALPEPGPAAVRKYAETTGEAGDSFLWGSGATTGLEAAILANCAAVRYLDFNDAYFGDASGTHPSDMIPALMLVADRYEANGRVLLDAILVGYEIAIRAADGLGARRRGWDHVNMTALGACAAAGRLMRLDPERLGHALAIAVVSHAAMGETREGHLSMWKGLAAADAVRHAVYACRLAESGVEGPAHPFLGDRGFLKLLLAGQFVDEGALRQLADSPAPLRILDTHIKAWPIGIVSQSGVDAALDISRSISGLEDIDAVVIETYRAAIDRNGSPEKWRPMTRETADHSLPYGVATALRDGRVDSASFDEQQVRSEAMHRFLAERVTLVEDPDLTAGYPEAFPTRVRVRTREGRELVSEVSYPRGHAKNPLSEGDLAAKYDSLVAGALSPDDARSLYARIVNLADEPDVLPINELLRKAGRV
ncbi:MAG TPA: MmgE/PrpD family protein [Acidimicrobiia bacterium]|nr:MmgE/PrpD family protein [Acidimicrobiia bacterium]